MLSLSLRRLRYRRRVAGTALERCWHTPLPSTGTDWRQVSFLVVDAEMSSLDVNEGELLSVGWVCVDGGGIALQTARHYLVKPQRSVGQSAAIHSLRDCELGDALPGEEVFGLFLEALAGRVLVAHNADLDLAYLNRVSCAAFNAPVLMPVVDTLRQEQGLLNRHEQPIKPGDLRLQACRERYNLPSFHGHNALLDALATAELLIAMAAQRSAGQRFPLRQLM